MSGRGVEFFTIGIYGTTAESFFGALKKHKITHFCDIRQRRGLRGSTYKYGNANELQDRLASLNIEYRHVIELAPSEEIRKIQMAADKKGGITGPSREEISPEFAKAYERCIKDFNFEAFLSTFPEGSRAVLFCVEHNPNACHRSLVAARMRDVLKADVQDITPD